MPQKRMTPVLYTKGKYTFKPPFDSVIPSEIVLTCIAIRSFSELVIKDKIDIFATYYTPQGISEALFSEDVSLNASIVTIQDDSGTVYFVPDTFILTMPDMNVVPYSNLLASVAIGPLPDALDVTFLIDLINTAVSQGIGKVPEVKIHKIPTTESVTMEQHLLNESARQSQVTNNNTAAARIYSQQTLIDAQHQRILMLEQLCRDNGLFD